MADSDQIWRVLRDQAAMYSTQFMGGVHLHVHTCARADVPPFPYLGSGWTDCAEIWFLVRDPLAWRFTNVNGGVQVHLRTCAPLFCISGTAGRIALTLGVWLENH